MCVICYKPKGAGLPNEKTFADMAKYNPDGMGYMCTDGSGYVHMAKGFFNVHDLLKDLSSVTHGKYDDYAIAFHARIATHGQVCDKLCHPFCVGKNTFKKHEKILRATRFVGAMHNGIIPSTTINPAKNESDTSAYCERILPNLLRYGDALLRSHVEVDIGVSRFILMFGDGRVVRAGTWQKDGDCMYSNLNFKSIPVRKYKPSPKSTYTYYPCDSSWMNDWETSIAPAPWDDDSTDMHTRFTLDK